jgi:type II secretory pathway pseudopilin PulG
MREHQGSSFTGIEAIVAVAIFGILATIAVPNFVRLQTRAKLAEAHTNLEALREAQTARYAELGNYVWAGSAPGGAPGPERRPWEGGNTLEYRELLGFSAADGVYFQYGVEAEGDAFTLTAVGELDGRGDPGQFALVHAGPGERIGLASALGDCSPRGVWNPAIGSADRLDVVGPCGPRGGRNNL